MINYLGKDLHTKVNKLITSAFYRTYLLPKKFEIEEINLNYSVCENEYDWPIVEVEVVFEDFNENQHLTLNIRLNESDDFNIGHLASAIERCESD